MNCCWAYMAADAAQREPYSMEDYITLIAACDPTPTHVLLLELMDLTGAARTPDIPTEAAKAFYEKHCKNVPVSDTKL
ncbi:MAG: hypothetical protein EOM66_02705 [Clostridia bacterium]|nr:hypothetical protein [Clostridia bacterium]